MSAEPITIKEWAKETLASCNGNNELFLKQAIELSWMTSKALRDLIATETVELEDIHSDNVLIFIEPRVTAATDDEDDWIADALQDALEGMLQIRAIHLQCEPPLPGMQGNGTHLNPPKVCVALGKILFDIFSSGSTASDSFETSLFNDNGNPKCNGADDSLTRENGSDERDMKRKTPPPLDNKTGAVLSNLGMPRSICQLVRDLLLNTKSKQHNSNTIAITSLGEALYDLTQEISI